MPDHNPYQTFAPPESEVFFVKFGKLLPALMLLLLPALILLFVFKNLHIQILYLLAGGVTLVLIFASSILIIISGVLGAAEYRKRRSLTHINAHAHKRPRRY